MFKLSPSIRSFFQNIFWPLFLASLPFFPDIYAKFQDENITLVYQVKYTKNPVIEWNRQIDSFLKELNVEQQQSVAVTNFLLKKISKEVNGAIPAILASSGYKPMDSMEVEIMNATSYDVKDVRVHFIGCSGFDSFKTYPDAYGNKENADSISNKDNVTIKYDSIPRVLDRSMSIAVITFYGLDASSCKPYVTASYKNGQSVKTNLVNDVNSYSTELAWKEYDEKRIFEIIYKIINGLALLFFYTQIKKLRTVSP